MERVALLWLRRDLRVHDHPALAAALASAQAVVPVFVLDPRLLDGPGASANRTWFLLGALRALAQDLEARGAPLVVRTGRPEDVIPAVAAEAPESLRKIRDQLQLRPGAAGPGAALTETGLIKAQPQPSTLTPSSTGKSLTDSARPESHPSATVLQRQFSLLARP
jgi:deoxyribodipyrimidine photo-lyase